MIDAKEFKEAMKLNQTSLVAFIAPWCGHCQKMVPEFSKAARGLNPLIGTYAIDCDDEKNKQLCAQQEVKGFPTIKLFPRGKYLPPMLYDQERTTTGFYNYASRRIPKTVSSLKTLDDVKEWVEKNKAGSTVALLLTKESKVPLLWKALGNRYPGTSLQFGAHSDKDGKAFKELFVSHKDEGDKSKVLLWVDGKGPRKYDGGGKYEPLTSFFDNLLEGKGDIGGLLVEQDEPMKHSDEDL